MKQSPRNGVDDRSHVIFPRRLEDIADPRVKKVPGARHFPFCLAMYVPFGHNPHDFMERIRRQFPLLQFAAGNATLLSAVLGVALRRAKILSWLSVWALPNAGAPGFSAKRPFGKRTLWAGREVKTEIPALEYPCEILAFYGFYMAFSGLLARLEPFYTAAR
jgi:hypothetical protein